MPLTSALGTPAALYRKLEREAYRAYHAHSPAHKADHFFNFCVTAHSMRDFCLEHLGKTQKSDQQPYHALWNKQPILVATTEIANSSKHFVLRTPGTQALTTPSTRGVRAGRAKYIDVYRRPDGELTLVQVSKAEVRIELSDGKVVQLYKFTGEVLAYWKSYLLSVGVKPRRVSLQEHNDA